MLGTPNLGSVCAYLIPWPQPSSYELRPDYIPKLSTNKVTARRGVPFSILAGTKFFTARATRHRPRRWGSRVQKRAAGRRDRRLCRRPHRSIHPFAMPGFDSQLRELRQTAPRRRRRADATAAAEALQPAAAAVRTSETSSRSCGDRRRSVGGRKIRTVSFGVTDASAIGGVLLAPGTVSAALKAPNGSIASILPGWHPRPLPSPSAPLPRSPRLGKRPNGRSGRRTLDRPIRPPLSPSGRRRDRHARRDRAGRT